MILRLKHNQTTEECNAYRCKKPPEGHYVGVGYLCQTHAEKWVSARAAGEDMGVTGAPPKYASDPSNLMQPPEGEKEELQQEALELREAYEEIKTFEIQDDDDVDFAKEELASVKGQWNELEKKRKGATGKLREVIKEIDSWYKPALSALKDIEALWKLKLAEEMHRRQEERKRLQEQARQAENPAEIRDTLVQASEQELKVEGVSFGQKWCYEIEDVDKLPREYMMPNTTMIGSVVRACKDKTDIPGVKVWPEDVVSSRSK